MSDKDCVTHLHPPSAHGVGVRPQEFRFRTRTPAPSYGLVFSLALFVLASYSSLSAGQNCTPVFEGSQFGAGAPGVEVTPSVIKVIEGASFNLTCTLSRHHNFEWRLNSSLLTDGNTYKQSDSVPSPGIYRTELYVFNISRNHSGEFTCVVAGCHSSSQAHHGLTVKVIYAEQPKILHPKRDNYSEVIADIGSNLEIRCESKEDVHEGVIWQRAIRDDTSYKWENLEGVCKRKNATVTDKKKSHCYIQETFENKTKVLTLFLQDMRQEDAGNYSCGIPIPDGAASSEIEMKKNDFISLRVAGKQKQSRVKRSAGHGGYVRPPPKFEGINWKDPVPVGPDQEKLKIIRKFDKGMNSTIANEGEPVLLFCNLTRGSDSDFSRRYQVAWRFREKDYSGKQLQFESDPEMKDKYKYYEDAGYTAITILSANASDKGWYQCSLWDSVEYGGKFSREAVVVTFDIRLRIREKMAPIYPFVSICVEVVLVFLIILIYEKNKSKTEVDESDTDGSPDQKNVSDNGDGGGSEGTRLGAKE